MFAYFGGNEIGLYEVVPCMFFGEQVASDGYTTLCVFFYVSLFGSYVGFVTDIFGRKYMCDTRENYKAVNYLIQGCAAGIIKKAMIDIDTLLKDRKSNMLLTIHDELVLEVHDSEEDLLPKVIDIMEDRDTFRVPILINVEKTTTNWAEKTTV